MRIQKTEKYASYDGNLKKTARPFLVAGWFHIAVVLVLLFPALSASGQFESASVPGYVK